MFPPAKSVIPHINNHRIIFKPIVFQILHYSGNAFIYSHQCFAIGLNNFFDILMRMIDIINTMPAISLLFYPFRPTQFFIILSKSLIIGCWQWIWHVFIHTNVAFRGHHGCVNCFMGEIKEEGFCLVSAFKPAYGMFCQ